MRNRFQLLSFLAGCLMVIALTQPTFVLADDDDEWDDDDIAVPSEVDDDDDWDDDDDDWDDDDDDDIQLPDVDVALPDEAIIHLNEGVDAQEFAADHDATILNTVPERNLVLLQLDPELDDQSEVAELTTDSRVTWSEINYTSQAPEGRPRYFFTSTVTQGGFVDAPALPAGLEFTVPAACADGSGLVVAVLDTGVDTEHPMLAANVADGGWNTLDNTEALGDVGDQVDNDADGQIDELVGHGTHVAGTIVMVAPETQILPYKVLNSDGVGSTYSVAAGIYMAVDVGADVINLSLGSTHDSVAIRMAVEYATANDVMVVAAAGNSSQYTPTEFPAAIDSVISVGAVDAVGDKASYSNFHESIDISAPGNNIASAHPDGRYLDASGTSMATPIVAGTLLLMIEQNPGVTLADLESQLKASSSPLNLTDPLLEGIMGAGEVNIDAAINCESANSHDLSRVSEIRIRNVD